jgi:proteasome lid subunit RPN8/RPN11
MCASAEACLPEEACGLLLGNGNLVSAALPITNMLHSPTRYRMEPSEQLQVFLRIDELKFELLGIYHTHPHGPTTPSETDIAEATYPDTLYIIMSLSRNNWMLRGFYIQKHEVYEIEITIDDSN